MGGDWESERKEEGSEYCGNGRDGRGREQKGWATEGNSWTGWHRITSGKRRVREM